MSNLADNALWLLAIVNNTSFSRSAILDKFESLTRGCFFFTDLGLTWLAVTADLDLC